MNFAGQNEFIEHAAHEVAKSNYEAFMDTEEKVPKALKRKATFLIQELEILYRRSPAFRETILKIVNDNDLPIFEQMGIINPYDWDNFWNSFHLSNFYAKFAKELFKRGDKEHIIKFITLRDPNWKPYKAAIDAYYGSKKNILSITVSR